jgi:hypothetical protein
LPEGETYRTVGAAKAMTAEQTTKTAIRAKRFISDLRHDVINRQVHHLRLTK